MGTPATDGVTFWRTDCRMGCDCFFTRESCLHLTIIHPRLATANVRPGNQLMGDVTFHSGCSEDAGESAVLAGSPVGAHRPPRLSLGWLNCSELRRPHDETDAGRSKRLDGMDRSQLESITRARLATEIGFVYSDAYAKPLVEQWLFKDHLALRNASPMGPSGARPNLPVHLERLCEAPLLTPRQEELLFRRMNFLRFRAALHRSSLNPTRPSRRRLGRIDELLALATWHRDRIVEANLRLVVSVVKPFVTCECTFDDLLSDGVFALMRAVDKFDVDRGFKFSTYATQVVRRCCYQTVMTKKDERSQRVAGLSPEDCDIDDDRSPAISEQRWQEMQIRLALLLSQLSRREQLILRARFSLGRHRRVRTLQMLADRLGISKERVRQIEKRAVAKLQAMASAS